jgi:hypothetical protein
LQQSTALSVTSRKAASLVASGCSAVGFSDSSGGVGYNAYSVDNGTKEPQHRGGWYGDEANVDVKSSRRHSAWYVCWPVEVSYGLREGRRPEHGIVMGGSAFLEEAAALLLEGSASSLVVVVVVEAAAYKQGSRQVGHLGGCGVGTIAAKVSRRARRRERCYIFCNGAGYGGTGSRGS